MAPATVRIYLCAMQEDKNLPAGKPTDTSRPIPARAVHRLLVVDDDVSLRQLSAELLNHSGYEVDAAEDGAAAWEALGAEGYDLMITDNKMPNLSGVELLKKLYAAHMDLPVIMASGTMPEEEFAQFPWLRPAGKLLKPYSVEELLGTVKRVLRETNTMTDGILRFRPHDAGEKQVLQTEGAISPTRLYRSNPPSRILVVDDNSDTRQLSVDVLSGSGYDVEAVLDGAAGWEALQNAGYDLIITDNKMPRMTGLEMIEKLRSARMTLPVIMATGHLPLNEFARRPWLKPDAMLQRPFSTDDLLETVVKVLGPAGNNDGRQEAPVPQRP